MHKVAEYFEFNSLGTSLKTEILAGLTTFLSMAYILFVNPNILSLNAVEGVYGIPQGAAFVATALTAAIGTLVMGVYAKYPIGVAPGMGVNSFFAFTLVAGMGIPWQTALAAVFVSGILFVLLAVSGAREAIINCIPRDIKLAIAAGIGLFISFIGFRTSGIIVSSGGPTLVTLGDLSTPNVALAVFGVFAIVILMVRRIKGAIFLGMLASVAVGVVFGILNPPTAFVGAIPSLTPTLGVAALNIGYLFSLEMLAVVLTLLFIDFFDTAGTLIAVTEQAGLSKDDRLPRAERALLADSSSTVVGALLGTSTTASYIESSAGIAVGGRSGFTAVVVAFCFVLSLFFSPLLTVITSAVTGPALIVVGILMASSLRDIDWKNVEIAIPSFFAVVLMPMTNSIITGLTVGVIFYPIVKLVAGKHKEVHPLMYCLALLFIAYHATGIY